MKLSLLLDIISSFYQYSFWYWCIILQKPTSYKQQTPILSIKSLPVKNTYQEAKFRGHLSSLVLSIANCVSYNHILSIWEYTFKV